MRLSRRLGSARDSWACRGQVRPGEGKDMTKALITLQTRVAGVLRNDKGATAVEYGLMVALIAVVIIVAVLTLGNKLSSLFSDTASQI